MAAAVPKTETTAFLIAVTFLPAPLHTPGTGVLCGWKSVLCCTVTYINLLCFHLGRMWRHDEEKLSGSALFLFSPC